MYVINKRVGNRRIYLLAMLSCIVLGSCKSLKPMATTKPIRLQKTVHPNAQNLLQRIQKIQKVGYAFGHQDATAYGIGWKNDGSIFKSDVHEVVGDHPAVHGFELGHIELGKAHNLDTVNFALMKRLIKKAHTKGGIITLSWHPDNPVSNKSAWHTRKAVKHILEGGKFYEKYKTWVTRVAYFINDLKDESGQPIPIVFRPFHEMNGAWFWWGKGHCSSQEFIRLWQETVFLLNQELKVDQVVYAYSPNAFNSKEEYLQYYPGDDFVDVLGVDIYQHWSTSSFMNTLATNLPILKEIAIEKNMPYALTEAGLNKLRVKDWWTQLDAHISDSGIAWALFWRNARLSHYFAPFPNQKSSEDFKRFNALPHVLFLKDIQNID